jgi:hypothetical protein
MQSFLNNPIPVLFAAAVSLIITSCGQTTNTNKKSLRDTLKVAAAITAPAPVAVADTTTADTGNIDPEKMVAPYYLVLVDTGHNFNSMKAISSKAASLLHCHFDMMGRIYKPGKGIVVPDNSESEVDRGEYYPRRPSEDENFVSIEMSNWFYNKEADESQMVAVAGMYSLQSQADSVASILKSNIPTTTIIKKDIYMGCMH